MSSNENPSLISGHANFAKGAATETIGNVSGSKEWTDSGVSTKQAGIDEMKAAGERRQNQEGTGMGKAEALAGKAVGCEGMEKEGNQSKSS